MIGLFTLCSVVESLLFACARCWLMCSKHPCTSRTLPTQPVLGLPTEPSMVGWVQLSSHQSVNGVFPNKQMYVKTPAVALIDANQSSIFTPEEPYTTIILLLLFSHNM